jgi:hypothetical protein
MTVNRVLQNAVRFAIRIPGALVAGWFLLIVPELIASLFGIPIGWGFFHSDLPLLCLPITIGVAYWLLGFFPWLRIVKAPSVESIP